MHKAKLDGLEEKDEKPLTSPDSAYIAVSNAVSFWSAPHFCHWSGRAVLDPSLAGKTHLCGQRHPALSHLDPGSFP